MRESTNDYGQQFDGFLRTFRPREIILRSEGKVHCVRLSSRFQMAVAALLVLAALWSVWSSFGWLVSQYRLATMAPELRQTREAYSQLLGEVQESYRQMASLADDLQDNGAAAGDAAGKEGAVPPAVAAARAALKQRLAGFQSDMQRLSDLNRTLTDQIAGLTQKLQASEVERQKLASAGGELEDRVRRLSLALADAGDERQTMNHRIASLEGQVALSQRTQQVLVTAVEQAQASGPLTHDAALNLYPMHRLWNGNGPEDALVLAVMRQESNFSMAAVSPAGAQGLMQLMPDTARYVADRLNIGYQPERLGTDADLNISLGRAYLDQLLNLFDRSYVLAIAAYNAGPARVLEWMRRYGDPRDPAVDVKAWVKSIPFVETRIYVQRVMKNLQDYRDALGPAPDERCMVTAAVSRAS
ncbi:MAG: transglycosylase SLT domain-containing protein [Dongiaceae bacterium]